MSTNDTARAATGAAPPRVKRPAAKPVTTHPTAAQIAATLPITAETLALARAVFGPGIAARREQRLAEHGELAAPQREAGETRRPSRARKRQRSSPPSGGAATADPVTAAPAAGLTGTMADFDTGAG